MASINLTRLADIPVITVWTESLWGSGGPWSRQRLVKNRVPHIPKQNRMKLRIPGREETAKLIERDGFHCRFCGIPVIRAEIRILMLSFGANIYSPAKICVDAAAR